MIRSMFSILFNIGYLYICVKFPMPIFVIIFLLSESVLETCSSLPVLIFVLIGIAAIACLIPLVLCWVVSKIFKLQIKLFIIPIIVGINSLIFLDMGIDNLKLSPLAELFIIALCMYASAAAAYSMAKKIRARVSVPVETKILDMTDRMERY